MNSAIGESVPALPVPPALLVWGFPRERWPDPLPQLLAARRFHLLALPTIYAIAAALADPSTRPAGLLVTLASLSPTQRRAITLVAARSALPLIAVPGAAPIGQPWADVDWDALQGLPPVPDPLPPAEIEMTDEVAARYDELGMQPILSDQEIRALLGSPD